MGDNLTNAWLRTKSYFRLFSNAAPNESGPEGTEFYTLKFKDEFTGDTIDTSVWLLGQPWGKFHPNHPHQYYGDTNEFINVQNGQLELYTRYRPKKFYDFKSSLYITIPYGIGLVFCKKPFKYGYYEMEAMLPKGKYLWPALWITAVKTWPPEIDILESFSGKNGEYIDNFRIRNARNEPNVHYGFVEDNTKSSYGAFSYPIPNEPTQRFVKYGLHWTEHFIRVYYDGYLVYQCTQKNILDYFNRPDVEMNIILNNAIQNEGAGLKLDTSVFKIKSVKYFSKT